MADTTLSRRRMLGMTAAGAATAAAVVTLPSAASGSDPAAGPDPGTVGQPVDPLGVPSVIVSRSGDGATLQALDAADAAAAAGVVPLVGFPADVEPRPGDHVTVSDGVDGLARAAVPLCHWHEGIPVADPPGRYTVAGYTTPPVEEIGPRTRSVLDEGHRLGVTVLACLLDTSNDDALVLEVRTVRSAPATA